MCNCYSDQNIISQKSLFNVLNKGGLTKPSKEFIFKSNIAEISKQFNIIQHLIVKSSAHLKINKLFTGISNYLLNQSLLNNHLLQMVNIILKMCL